MQETQTQSARVMFTKWPLLRDYLVVGDAFAERFGKELMYGLSFGTKKSGHCREVAIVKRWLLVEV